MSPPRRPDMIEKHFTVEKDVKSLVIHLLEVKGGLLLLFLSMIQLQNSLVNNENELNMLVLLIRTDSANLF